MFVAASRPASPCSSASSSPSRPDGDAGQPVPDRHARAGRQQRLQRGLVSALRLPAHRWPSGVMQIGSEYRHKTITSTFLGTPERAKVMRRQGDRPARHRRHLRARSRWLGSVIAGAIVLNARGSTRSRRPEVCRRWPEPAGPSAVGADRARRRHPHPQPGRGAADLGRRRLDRRAPGRLRTRLLGPGSGRTSSSTCRQPHQGMVIRRRPDGRRGDPSAQPSSRWWVRRPGARRVCRGAGRVRLRGAPPQRHQLEPATRHTSSAGRLPACGTRHPRSRLRRRSAPARLAPLTRLWACSRGRSSRRGTPHVTGPLGRAEHAG